MAGRWKLFGSTKMPDYVENDFTQAFDASFWPTNATMSSEELIASLEGKDVLLAWIGDRLDADTLERLPASVKAIATYSVGYNHIDLDAAKARGVAVLNTPGVSTDTVADAALLLVLSVARRVRESNDLIRSKWTGWTPLQLVGVELAGKTMGIFGFGRIGQKIAERARAFGMRIEYTDLSRFPADVEKGAVFVKEVDDLLTRADFLVLAANPTPSTRGFLNRARIALMKNSAAVINIARGDFVDDDALIEALASGRLRGAGLDVYNKEPNFDQRYRDLPNAFIMPHIGSSTEEARRRMGLILIEGLQALIEGRPAANRLV